jgi:hypothetical protein
MNRIHLQPKYTKTYKTVERLDKAIKDLGLQDNRHLLTYTEDGRCTAVFLYTKNLNLAYIVHNGFMVAG